VIPNLSTLALPGCNNIVFCRLPTAVGRQRCNRGAHGQPGAVDAGAVGAGKRLRKPAPAHEPQQPAETGQARLLSQPCKPGSSHPHATQGFMRCCSGPAEVWQGPLIPCLPLFQYMRLPLLRTPMMCTLP